MLILILFPPLAIFVDQGIKGVVPIVISTILTFKFYDADRDRVLLEDGVFNNTMLNYNKEVASRPNIIKNNSNGIIKNDVNNLFSNSFIIRYYQNFFLSFCKY